MTPLNMLERLQEIDVCLEKSQRGLTSYLTAARAKIATLRDDIVTEQARPPDPPIRLDGADSMPLHLDDELLRRWLRAQALHPRILGGTPLWAKVRDVFCIGSTSAKNVCTRHGSDPDLQVKKR